MSKQYSIEPIPISPLVYDIPLPQTGHYLTNMRLNCHPVVTDANFMQGYTLRIPIRDIKTVEYITDNQAVYTIENSDHTDLTGVNLINPVYNIGLDFLADDKIITAALKPVKLRLTFIRPPVLPLWFTCNVNYSDVDYWSNGQPVQMNGYYYWNFSVWR
jgi:hypothetical protein